MFKLIAVHQLTVTGALSVEKSDTEYKKMCTDTGLRVTYGRSVNAWQSLHALFPLWTLYGT